MSNAIDPILANLQEDPQPSATGAIGQRLDTRGLSCPMPIVKTTQAIATLVSGQMLEVIAYHPRSVTDFRAWAQSTGNALVDSSVDGDAYRFVFRKK